MQRGAGADMKRREFIGLVGGSVGFMATRGARAAALYSFGQRSSDTREPNMTDTPEYTPPEVWVWEKGDSPKWRYSNTNRPIAGATHEKALPRGKHPLQLYSQ